jgi:hypothetical protein
VGRDDGDNDSEFPSHDGALAGIHGGTAA